MAGMAELYRREGYAEVAIDTAVSSTAGADDRVRLVTAVVTVTEGTRSFVESVAFEGNRAMSDGMLRSLAALETGQPFYVPEVNAAADAIALEYANQGYQAVSVTSTWTPSADGRSVGVTFRVTEGPQVIVDQIIVAGNVRTRSGVIENELTFRSGDPLGQDDIIESYRRLGALGLFRRTAISQIRHAGEEQRQDVLVTVEEARATTWGFGGGPEGGGACAARPTAAVSPKSGSSSGRGASSRSVAGTSGGRTGRLICLAASASVPGATASSRFPIRPARPDTGSTSTGCC